MEQHFELIGVVKSRVRIPFHVVHITIRIVCRLANFSSTAAALVPQFVGYSCLDRYRPVSFNQICTRASNQAICCRSRVISVAHFRSAHLPPARHRYHDRNLSHLNYWCYPTNCQLANICSLIDSAHTFGLIVAHKQKLKSVNDI